MNAKKKLKELINIVIKEMDQNPEFSDKIEKILLGEGNEGVKVKRNRQPAIINPLEVVIHGNDVLENKLEQLDIEQLKDIISQYGMDPSKLALKWKKKERLIKHIIDVTSTRVNKGNAFREN